MPLRTVPFEESRSRSTHFPDSDPMERCLVEIPASLIGRLFPRTIRPTLMVDPTRYSMLSPSRGPWTITSFRGKQSILKHGEEMKMEGSPLNFGFQTRAETA